MAKTIRVRAASGLSLPIPAGTAINTVARAFTSEAVVECYLNSFVIRRMAAGDLVEVGAAAKSKTKKAKAKGVTGAAK